MAMLSDDNPVSLIDILINHVSLFACINVKVIVVIGSWVDRELGLHAPFMWLFWLTHCCDEASFEMITDSPKHISLLD